MADLLPLARRLPERLVLADVGVRWGFSERWTALAPAATLVGFDADADECRALAARHAALPDARLHAVALGERPGPAVLHVTAEPGSSSLLPPDPSAARLWPALAGTALAREVPVELNTLAAWAAREGVARLDALKLDVQGAELAVLRGAGALLDGVRAVETEVELNPIYHGQPLFGDVDAYLRDRGFVLWRLDDLHHHLPAGAPPVLTRERRRYDGLPEVVLRGGGGQLFWAQATYVRPLEESRDAWTLARDAVVADALGLDDLAAVLLARVAREAPPELAVPAAGALEVRLARGKWPLRLWRARHRDVLGAARRLVTVRRLALAGRSDEEISSRTGLSVDNVALLRRGPWPRRRPSPGDGTTEP